MPDQALIQLADQLGKLLLQKKMVLATAESCTGGGVAYIITEIAGSSAWFDRGFVTYSNEAKQELLNVSAQSLKEEGAVSKTVAIEMVKGALKNSRADIAVAITGIAGPGGGSEKKPVGTVWFAWASKTVAPIAKHHLLKGDRAQIRQQSIQVALQGLIDYMSSTSERA